jgi:hypothetical protein
MSSGDPSARLSTQPKLEEAIQKSYKGFEANFKAEHDDDRIKENPSLCMVYRPRRYLEGRGSNPKGTP